MCTRFPWLPRRWWAYHPPDALPSTQPAPAMSPKDELTVLEDYEKTLEAERADLDEEIGVVEARVKELKAVTGPETKQ